MSFFALAGAKGTPDLFNTAASETENHDPTLNLSSGSYPRYSRTSSGNCNAYSQIAFDVGHERLVEAVHDVSQDFVTGLAFVGGGSVAASSLQRPVDTAAAKLRLVLPLEGRVERAVDRLAVAVQTIDQLVVLFAIARVNPQHDPARVPFHSESEVERPPADDRYVRLDPADGGRP